MNREDLISLNIHYSQLSVSNELIQQVVATSRMKRNENGKYTIAQHSLQKKIGRNDKFSIFGVSRNCKIEQGKAEEIIQYILGSRTLIGRKVSNTSRVKSGYKFKMEEYYSPGLTIDVDGNFIGFDN